MSSNKKILQNPIHKEIEDIKDRLGREIYSLPWNEYKRKLEKTVNAFLTEGGYYPLPSDRPEISVIRKTR